MTFRKKTRGLHGNKKACTVNRSFHNSRLIFPLKTLLRDAFVKTILWITIVPEVKFRFPLKKFPIVKRKENLMAHFSNSLRSFISLFCFVFCARASDFVLCSLPSIFVLLSFLRLLWNFCYCRRTSERRRQREKLLLPKTWPRFPVCYICDFAPFLLVQRVSV